MPLPFSLLSDLLLIGRHLEPTFLFWDPFDFLFLHLDLWKNIFQVWTQEVGAMVHDAEVTYLGAMTHGARLLRSRWGGIYVAATSAPQLMALSSAPHVQAQGRRAFPVTPSFLLGLGTCRVFNLASSPNAMQPMQLGYACQHAAAKNAAVSDLWLATEEFACDAGCARPHDLHDEGRYWCRIN